VLSACFSSRMFSFAWFDSYLDGRPLTRLHTSPFPYRCGTTSSKSPPLAPCGQSEFAPSVIPLIFCILQPLARTVSLDAQDRSDVSLLLHAAGNGDAEALEALLPLLYDELHQLAHRQRRRQGAPSTLNTTALLHEAYLKLANADGSFEDRAHFFRIAAKSMRQ